MSEKEYNNGSDLGAVIAKHEGNYNSFNRGNAGDSKGEKINLSNMTMDEIQNRQHLDKKNSDRLFAVGKYQIIPETMDGAVKALNISGDEKFTPELQEHIFANYLIAEKRPAIKDFITGKSSGPNGLKHAQIAVAYEWASVADPTTGKSKYGKIGHNHAATSSKEVADSLTRMRNKYQSNIDDGMSPDDAYKNVTGVNNNINNLNSTKIIKFGEKSQDVLQLQKNLNDLGVQLTADGHFGNQTKQAVIDYQTKHHLTADGIAGTKTLSAIEHELQNKKEIQSQEIKISDFANNLIKQAKSLCQQKIGELGFKWDQGMENSSLALGCLALSNGFQAITNLELSDDLKTIHIGDLSQDRFLNASIPSAVAAQTNSEESMANIAQLEQKPTQQQQQQQQQEQPKDQAQQPTVDPTKNHNL